MDFEDHLNKLLETIGNGDRTYEHSRDIHARVDNLWKANYSGSAPMAVQLAGLYSQLEEIASGRHSIEVIAGNAIARVQLTGAAASFYELSRAFNQTPAAQRLWDDVAYMLAVKDGQVTASGEIRDKYSGTYDLNQAAKIVGKVIEKK
jgi:hypothetical protein